MRQSIASTPHWRAEIQRRNYHGMPSSAIHRLNYVFDLACEADLEADLRQKEFLGVRMGEHEPIRKEICGAGLFTHVRVCSLREVAALAAEAARLSRSWVSPLKNCGNSRSRWAPKASTGSCRSARLSRSTPTGMASI